MQKAAGTLTNPEAGVMVASPATMPEAAAQHARFAFQIPFRQVQLKAAAAAEKCVAANALVARAPALSALPALKPNQPTHKQSRADE